MLNFYSKKLKTECGTKAFIKTAAAAVETLACENAEAFGYGKELLASYGGFWIVSKIRFSINKYPEKNGEILAETWPLPPSRIKTERQYRLRSEEGEILLNASSEWCILSISERRPMRMENDVFSGGNDYVMEKSGAGDFLRIRPEFTEANFCCEREIINDDIDENKHTNNKKYTEMVLNCFSDEYLNKKPVLVYELHFLKETRLGDKIRIYKYQKEDKTIITGVCDGNTVFNAVLEIGE